MWKKNGLALVRRKPHRRIRKGLSRKHQASAVNELWAIDFVHDECANGQKLKCLTVVDEVSKESLAIEVEGRLRAKQVLAVLARLFALYGKPKYLRMDNGPEFIAKALQSWLKATVWNGLRAGRRPRLLSKCGAATTMNSDRTAA